MSAIYNFAKSWVITPVYNTVSSIVWGSKANETQGKEPAAAAAVFANATHGPAQQNMADRAVPIKQAGPTGNGGNGGLDEEQPGAAQRAQTPPQAPAAVLVGGMEYSDLVDVSLEDEVARSEDVSTTNYVPCLNCGKIALVAGASAGLGAASGALAAEALGMSSCTGAVFGASGGCSAGCVEPLVEKILNTDREEASCCSRVVATAAAFFAGAGVGYGITKAAGMGMSFAPTALKLAGATLGFSVGFLGIAGFATYCAVKKCTRYLDDLEGGASPILRAQGASYGAPSQENIV